MGHLGKVSVFSIFLVLFGMGCFKNSSLTGGTETETTLAGRIMNKGGLPAANATVILLPNDYNPLAKKPRAPLIKKTDVEGRYSFSDLPPGSYNIQAHAQLGEETVLIHDVEVNEPLDIGAEPQAISVGVLVKPGRILVPWERMPIRSGWIYLPGSTLLISIQEKNGTADGLLIDHVPTGTYTALFATVEMRERGSNILQEVLRVESELSTIVPPYASWNQSRHLNLNTTPAGAAILGNVLAYPLLVRLDSTNFDFSLAKSNGGDIRFAKSDGSPLPYQIERWDAVARQAEVWVRVDSLYGNRESQYLLMYFGKLDGIDLSDGQSVFSPVGGFQGVWHLNEDGVGTGLSSLYQDASGNGNHGSDQILETAKDGIIGHGQGFNGIGDFIDLAASKEFFTVANQPFTLSTWFKPDTGTNWSSPDKDTRLLDVHRTDSNGSSIALGFGRGQKVFIYNHKSAGTYLSKDTVSVGHWHFASLTYDGKALRLYVDGVLAHDPIVTGVLEGGTYRAKIGKYGDTPVNAFAGSIDEPRISRIARSSQWIKLDYESQLTRQRVVQIMP